MSIKVAEEWLNACSGCEIAIVDLGERLLDILNLVDFVHMPVIMDHKLYGQLGDQKHIHIPEADVGILTGGIRNEEHLEVALEMRKKCNLIIALGTCATHGGIPALANSWTPGEMMERVFTTETTDQPAAYPAEGVPPLLESCYAVDEKIKVDIYLPGCPPSADAIWFTLTELLAGRMPDLKGKNLDWH